jgi:hypothetical protein
VSDVPRTPDVDVIATARGGRENTEAIIAGGALLGFESSDVPPPFGRVDFIDWPFRSGGRTGWARHYNYVAEYAPRYAVAPDVQGDVEMDWVLERAAMLDRHADTVIVPTKSVHPDDVPARYRVGVPFASAEWSGGTAYPLEAYRGRPIHVLGGDPNRVWTTFIEPFLEQERDPPYTLASYDSGRPYLIAEKGEVWEAGRGRVKRPELTLRERMALIVANIRMAFQPHQIQNFEQALLSGRVPPALSEDMIESERDRGRFERVMGESTDAFRRQTPGPLALPDRDVEPIDVDTTDIQPATSTGSPDDRTRQQDLETLAEQASTESVDRPERERQAGLDEWEPDTEGGQAVKDAIENDTDDDEA